MPKVSVIIPNYNHALYLEQRINSVLNQTYKDFEVIILDDCSSDNSREIIERFRQHEKVSSIVYNDSNTGNPFHQWDRGIQLASGEYIWIAESDDWCENSFLENLAEALDKNPTCVLSYCQSYCIGDDNCIRFQSNHTSLGEYVNGKKFISNYIARRNPIFNASMAIWRRNAYTRISKDYMNYQLAGDYYFWIELCACGDVYISGKLLNYFRQHNQNVSFNAAMNGLGLNEQAMILQNLLEKNILTRDDYLQAIKKLYREFRNNEKNMQKDDALQLNSFFKKKSGHNFTLHLYHFQKSMQSSLKKLLHI